MGTRTLQPDILAAIYGGVADQARFGRALTMLTEEFASPSIALLSMDPRSPGADIWAAQGIMGQAEALEAYRRDFAILDPAPAAFAQTRSLGATTTARMMEEGRLSAADARTTAFLHEFYHPLGLVECLGGNLSTRSGHTALFGIHRGDERGAFSPEDIELAERYAPHLAQALHLRRLLTEAQAKGALLSSVLDRIAAGIVLRDRDGRINHCNRAALEIAARGDGLAISRDGLPLSASASANQALRSICGRIVAGESGGTVAFPRKTAAMPYTLLATPLAESASEALALGLGPCILFVVHDPDARIVTPVETIAKAFGLPPRTAEMLLAMANGEGAASYAERRGISANAVKFHLRTAFSRTGLHRQSDLLKAVIRVVSDLGRRSDR